MEHRPPTRRGRDSGHRRGLCRERGAVEACGLQRGRAARRPRLPDRAVPFARLQRPDGRLWRQLRGAHPLHARGDGGGPRRLRGGFHRRHQAAGGRACAGRHRPRRGGAYRPRRRGRRRARLSLLQPGRVRARVRYPSARHALPAPAVPAAPHAAPRGRRWAPGDRPRQDRIGRGGRGRACRGRLRHGRLQPPADLGRRLAAQDSGRPGRRRARLHVLQLLLGRDSRRQTHPLLPEPRAGERGGGRLAASARRCPQARGGDRRRARGVGGRVGRSRERACGYRLLGKYRAGRRGTPRSQPAGPGGGGEDRRIPA